jgi:hypothetical protein
LQEALKPSQDLKPGYGLIWWLPAQSMIPNAPEDMVAGLGKLSRVVLILRSRQLVVTRLGDQASNGFARKFWNRLAAAMPDRQK